MEKTYISLGNLEEELGIIIQIDGDEMVFSNLPKEEVVKKFSEFIVELKEVK